VGKPAQEAVDTIKAQAPGFKVQTIGHDMMATTDWRCDRSATDMHNLALQDVHADKQHVGLLALGTPAPQQEA
jgi:hypothetical protein